MSMQEYESRGVSPTEKSPFESKVKRANGEAFTVKLLDEGEVKNWREAVADVAPEFSNMALVGLSAINASVHELVNGDKEKIKELHSFPLFDEDSNEYFINRAFYQAYPMLETFGSGLDKTSNLFDQGAVLLKTAKTASEFKDAATPKVRQYKTVAGWNVRELIYELPIYNQDRERCALLLNTHPPIAVAMRYRQTDRGEGYDTPKNLYLASRLHTLEPTSAFVTVAVGTETEFGRTASSRTDAGFIENGMFGEPLRVYGARNLSDMSTVLSIAAKRASGKK